MFILGTGQLTAFELTPVEYIAAAAEAGLSTVSLFLNPMANISGRCMTTAENCKAVIDTLRATDMQVANIEVFPLLPDLNIENYRLALEMGNKLGARSVTVLLYDADEARVIDSLSRLCDMTRELGLKVGIEFMPLAPGWTTIEQTAELITKINKPNLGIGVDLLHLIRSGGTPADMAAIDPKLISYAQLCDSASTLATIDYIEEATERRLTPGVGRLPIKEFIQALPKGIPLELEVPQPMDIPARERIKTIADAARRQIALAGIY